MFKDLYVPFCLRKMTSLDLYLIFRIKIWAASEIYLHVSVSKFSEMKIKRPLFLEAQKAKETITFMNTILPHKNVRFSNRASKSATPA